MFFFYQENICLSLNHFDSSPCHSQADIPHLPTHPYTYCSSLRKYLSCSLRGVAVLYQGSAQPPSQPRAPFYWVPEPLCSSVPISHFSMPPCLAACNMRLTQAPSFMAELEERVSSLHCCHSNTFHRCSLQSLQVFQFSMAALFFRGFV